MNKGRWVLLAFGAAALFLIALPVATVWTMTRPGAPEQGLDGAISKAFLAARTDDAAPSASTRPVPAAAALLPKGMPETAVFKTLAASGFTCATDSNAATCFRSHGDRRCQDEWNVRLIFSDDGTIWSTKTDSKTACR